MASRKFLSISLCNDDDFAHPNLTGSEGTSDGARHRAVEGIALNALLDVSSRYPYTHNLPPSVDFGDQFEVSAGKPSRAVLSLAALEESIQTGKEEVPPWLIPTRSN